MKAAAVKLIIIYCDRSARARLIEVNYPLDKKGMGLYSIKAIFASLSSQPRSNERKLDELARKHGGDRSRRRRSEIEPFDDWPGLKQRQSTIGKEELAGATRISSNVNREPV